MGVLVCMVNLTVCSYHITYTCQSESTLYSCLNVKELLAWNRHDIWSLSDCNRVQTHNHLVHKQTLNHLAKLTKWLSYIVSTYLQWVLIIVCSYNVTYAFQSETTLCSHCCSHLNFRYYTSFKQGVAWHSGNYRLWIHSEMHMWHDKNMQPCDNFSQSSPIRSWGFNLLLVFKNSVAPISQSCRDY